MSVIARYMNTAIEENNIEYRKPKELGKSNWLVIESDQLSSQRLSGFPVGIILYLSYIIQDQGLAFCHRVPWPIRQSGTFRIAGLHELHKRV
jgi:hypothetical protein